MSLLVMWRCNDICCMTKDGHQESWLPQALSKRHSTTEEALRVASDMGAYCHILTHFSQRYPKIPIGIPTSGGVHLVYDCTTFAMSPLSRYITVSMSAKIAYLGGAW
jgi:hypothetical protein